MPMRRPRMAAGEASPRGAVTLRWLTFQWCCASRGAIMSRISLATFFSDVDVLLALAPEELAPFLLRLARANLQNGIFLPDGASDVQSAMGSESDAYRASPFSSKE